MDPELLGAYLRSETHHDKAIRYLVRLIYQANGNLLDLARRAKIPRRTIYYWIDKYPQLHQALHNARQ